MRVQALSKRVVLLALVAMAVVSFVPTSASAHDSQFCGHYTLSGKYNQLVYLGYRNFNRTPQTYWHSHDAEHRFRRNTNTTFSFSHYASHDCGWDYYNRSSGEAVHGAETSVVEPDLPQELPCFRCGLTRRARRPSDVAASLAAQGRSVSYMALLDGAKPSRTLAAPADTCVTAVFDDPTAIVANRMVVEVSDARTARRLGHAC